MMRVERHEGRGSIHGYFHTQSNATCTILAHNLQLILYLSLGLAPHRVSDYDPYLASITVQRKK